MVSRATIETRRSLRVLTSRPYLVLLALIGPVQIIFNAVVGDNIRFLGHTLAVLGPLIFLLAAGLLWLMDAQSIRPNTYLVAFALLASALWIFVVAREWWGGQGYNFSAFVLVPAIWLIALKPPTFPEARCAADVFVVALAVASIAGTVLDLFGYPLSNQFAPGRSILGFLPGLFEYRWVGVFETTTQASAVGSYLLIYGLWRRGWVFGFVGAVGIFILVAGASRGALAAATVGVLTILWFVPTVLKIRLTFTRRAFTTLAVIVAAAAAITRVDPTMSGRTPIWRAYLVELFPISPVVGLGSMDLDATVQADWVLRNNGAMMHAHNIFIDALARYGVIGLIVVGGLLVFSVVLGVRAGRAGLWVAPSLIAAFVVNQLSDVHIDWRYLDYDYSVLILSVVLAASYLSQTRSRDETSTVSEPIERDT